MSSLDRVPWTVDRGPWRGTFWACGTELAVRAVGVGVGAAGAGLSCAAAVSTFVGPDVATKRAGLLGRRKKCGTGWEAEAGAAAEAEAVGCGAVRSMQSEAVVLIVEISVNRQERQSTVNKERKGTTMGYQKKTSEDGRLIQNCATTGAAAKVKLAR